MAKLREHEAELKSVGIEHLSLFGSKARGEDTPESDVDLIAEFDNAMTFFASGYGGTGKPPR